MKNLKFIFVTLLFLLALISKAESGKFSYELEKFKSEKSFTTSKTAFSTSILVHAKDHDVHFKNKKKIKNRATTSESCTVRTPYLVKLVDFKSFKNRLIYGIATIYHIQRYTYLHLYQLF